VIEIDGSHGEGGGQIVRTSISLAAATGKPCRIFNIRARREKPGLMRQHLHCVRALAELSRATVDGDFLGSNAITFQPRGVTGNGLSCNLETAASITLLLQGLIPTALSAPSPVTITIAGGATDTSKAPTLDHFRQVFLRHLDAAGIGTRMMIARRGYYPPGGAQAALTVEPGEPRSFNLVERGDLRRIAIYSSASEFLRARWVAERQADAAEALLSGANVEVEKALEYSPSLSPGSACCVVAEFANTWLGADRIGARGVRAEDVGAQAARDLIRALDSGACVDLHMTDQILPFMALAGGLSSLAVSQITEHARTNMWAIEHFIDGRFEARQNLIRWHGSK